MFSEVKNIPDNFKLIIPINKYVKIYQKGTDFISSIRVPILFGKKKYYLKLSGITPKYVEDHLAPPMGFTFEEFDSFNEHLVSLCLSIVKILQNREKYKGSAIYSMAPAEICSVFLAAAMTGFMEEEKFMDPVLYVLAQTLQIVYGIAQDRAKNKN